MNEVEKMYRNSGIKKYKKTMLDIETGKNVLTLDSFYPEFTAEKQLEIIKLLCTKRYIDIRFTPKKEYYIFAYFVGCGFDKNFDEALAMFVNQYWNELSEEEHTRIKEILSE